MSLPASAAAALRRAASSRLSLALGSSSTRTAAHPDCIPNEGPSTWRSVSSASSPPSPPRRERSAPQRDDFLIRTPRARPLRHSKDVGTSGRPSPRTGSNGVSRSKRGHRPIGPTGDIFGSLREQLASGDLDLVWTEWQRLEGLGGLDILANRDYVDIFRLCSSRIKYRRARVGTAQNMTAWDERLTCWASAAAKRDSLGPLTADWAALAITAGRHDVVAALLVEAFRDRATPSSTSTPGQAGVEGKSTAVASAAATEALAPPTTTSEPSTSDLLDSSDMQEATGDNPGDASASSSVPAVDTKRGSDRQAAFHDLVAVFVVSKAIQDDLPGLVEVMGSLGIVNTFNTFFKLDIVEKLSARIFADLSAQQKHGAARDSASNLRQPSSEPASVRPSEAYSDRTNRFLSHAELARFLSADGHSSSRSIARLLGRLFNRQRPNDAYSIFRAAMDAASGPDAWLLTEPGLSEGEAAGKLVWTEACWCVCLCGLLAAGKADLAQSVYAKYLGLGLQPTLPIYNALLDGYSRSKNFDAAIRLWLQLSDPAAAGQGEGGGKSAATIVPDASMYTTMISIFFKNRQPEAARALFEIMRARHASNVDRFAIPPESCNAIIHGLCSNNQLTEALDVFQQMRDRGPAPNIGTVNALLRAHGRRGDLAAIAALVRTLSELQLRPDVITLTTLLDALLRKGGSSTSDSVKNVIGVMDELGIRANAVTYTALIKACLVGASVSSIDHAAERMFSARRGGSSSSSAAMASLRGGDGGDDAMEPRIDAALELLDRMIKERIQPTVVTYTALIAAVLQNPAVVAHSLAERQLPTRYAGLPRLRRELGETEDILHGWRATTPDVSLSLVLLDKLRERGLSPNETTYHFLIAGLSQPSADRAALIRALWLIDEMVTPSTLRGRVTSSGGGGGGGSFSPFVSSALDESGREMAFPRQLLEQAATLSYTTWLVVVSSLSERVQRGAKSRAERDECLRALRTALRLMRECGAVDILKGNDGGGALRRIVERASSILSSA